jgi:hypothetical protein
MRVDLAAARALEVLADDDPLGRRDVARNFERVRHRVVFGPAFDEFDGALTVAIEIRHTSPRRRGMLVRAIFSKAIILLTGRLEERPDGRPPSGELGGHPEPQQHLFLG